MMLRLQGCKASEVQRAETEFIEATKSSISKMYVVLLTGESQTKSAVRDE